MDVFLFVVFCALLSLSLACAKETVLVSLPAQFSEPHKIQKGIFLLCNMAELYFTCNFV